MRKQILFILYVIFLYAAIPVSAQNNSFYERLIKKGYDTINIENIGVRQFLDDNSYNKPELTGNYNFSVVKKYSKGVPSKPNGILLTWNSSTPVEEISSVVVSLVVLDREKEESALGEYFTGRNVKRYYPDVDSKEYLLCNMCPKKYCYYRVDEIKKNGRRTTLKKGKFYTCGRIRMLRVDGMCNVRDFGGWSTSFGKPVVFGKLFRGNRPDVITATGKNDFVKNEHISVDLDLRGSDLGESPFGPLDDVEYYCTDNARYKLALTSRTEVLVQDLNIIASELNRGHPIFFHCYHGANRAGTLAFIIDGLLGLSEADISKEYELTSFAFGNQRNKTFGEMIPYIRSYGRPGDDLAQCFYNFAVHIGVSEDRLDAIRCEMLRLSADDPLILKAHR